MQRVDNYCLCPFPCLTLFVRGMIVNQEVVRIDICSCSNWNNHPAYINGRSCAHLYALLGPKYEAARLGQNNDTMWSNFLDSLPAQNDPATKSVPSPPIKTTRQPPPADAAPARGPNTPPNRTSDRAEYSFGKAIITSVGRRCEVVMLDNESKGANAHFSIPHRKNCKHVIRSIINIKFRGHTLKGKPKNPSQRD